MNDAQENLAEDAACVPLLEAYLNDLHAGRQDRQRILSQHPELAGMLACLDSLERLIPEGPPLDELPTLTPTPDVEKLPSTILYSGPAAELGKYELLAELGRGGMGVVYKARQKDLDRIVALKMILGSQLAGPEQVERFHTEARAAARLRHPNIVQVLEAGEIAGQHYFAMQYIEGPSLDALLRTAPPPLEQSVRILADIARAVAYLHQHGVVHRDLKPSNIMLGSRPSAAGHRPELGEPIPDNSQPILTDFGLAKLMEGGDAMTRTGAILGTPSYMAPEQAASGKNVGPASDIYSLGAILYEVLTGRPPFREATPLDTLVQVIEGEPTLPRQINTGVPRALELICLKCLEKLPERRYASATDLADDLERYLDGEAVTARPQGPAQHLLRWARREPALVARLFGLALFAAVIQLTFMISPHEQPSLHYMVLGVTALWAAFSWLCQRLLRNENWTDWVKTLWSCGEPFLLTMLLYLTNNAATVLVGAYPLFIAGSGLWFQTRLVWRTTVATFLAFVILVSATPELRVNPHHAIVFMGCLFILGAIVAHQVERMRVLSRHYSSRTLP